MSKTGRGDSQSFITMLILSVLILSPALLFADKIITAGETTSTDAVVMETQLIPSDNPSHVSSIPVASAMADGSEKNTSMTPEVKTTESETDQPTPKVLLVRKEAASKTDETATSTPSTEEQIKPETQIPQTALEEGKKDEIEIVKTVEHTSGEVVRMEGQLIQIIYSRTKNAEYEMLLPVNKETALDGYRKTSDILAGDKVELVFEKTVTGPGTPDELVERVVKKIRFIKRPDQIKSLHSKEDE